MARKEDSKMDVEESNLHTPTFHFQQVSPTILCHSPNTINSTNIISKLLKALISSMDWLRDALKDIKHSLYGEIHAEF